MISSAIRPDGTVQESIPSRLEIDVSKVRNTNADKFPLGPITEADQCKRDGEWINKQMYKCNPFGWDSFKAYDKAIDKDPTLEGKVHKQMIVLQFSVSPDLNSALQALDKSSLSVHFIVDKDGSVTQLVDIYYRAYALGVGDLAEGSFLHPKDSTGQDIKHAAVKDNLNSFAISIMNVNNGKEPLTDSQKRSTAILMDDLCNNVPTLDAKKVIGHCDWTPGRQVSPGPYLPWQEFANASAIYKDDGVTRDFGLFPKDVPPVDKPNEVLLSWNHVKQPNETVNLPANITKCGTLLQNYGYAGLEKAIASGVMDDNLGKALLSFRLHFNGQYIINDATQKALWDQSVIKPDQVNLDALKQLATFTNEDAAILGALSKLIPAATIGEIVSDEGVGIKAEDGCI